MVKFFFLGRSLEGILHDAQSVLPEGGEIVVVTRDGDTLPMPEGLDARRLTVGEAVVFLSALPADEVVELVANGGTSAQQVPLLHTLFGGAFKGCFRVWDLQRDGQVLLAERGQHQ